MRGICIDGDDTLWATTPLYDQASASVVAHIQARRPELDRGTISSWMDAHDVMLARSMGYSPERFPRTCFDATLHFLGDARASETARTIGRGVFLHSANMRDDTPAALKRLKALGPVILVTAGDAMVQHRRVRQFPLRALFTAVHIVSSKTPEVFKDILFTHGLSARDSWMIGDSLRSDIVPASQAGMNTVHLMTQNWAGFEVHGHDLPKNSHVATSLTQACDAVEAFVRAPHADLAVAG